MHVIHLPCQIIFLFSSLFHTTGCNRNPLWIFQQYYMSSKGFLGSKVEILTKFIDQINGLIISLMYGEIHL